MRATNDKIIVRANPDQKYSYFSGETEIIVPLLFEVNYREKSPVISQVVSGNDIVSAGDILLLHHNTLYQPSPYYLYDDLFSIPANGKIIFCKLNVHDGSLLPIYGNMLCDVVDIKTPFPVPVSEQKQHTNRVIVTDPGYCNYSKGDFIFTRPYAAYQIVYNWNKELKRVYKCYEEQVCGILLYSE